MAADGTNITGTILVHHPPKSLRLNYERIYASDQIERFKITSIDKNGGEHSLVVQGNRPFLKITKARKAIKWQLIEGEVKSGSFWAFMILALEQEIEALRLD